MKPTPVLSAAFLNKLKPRAKEYTLRDGLCPGLGLRVQPSGSMSWVLSQRVDGKPRRFTLGNWPDMSPDQARAARYAQRASLSGELAAAMPPKAKTKAMRFDALATRFVKDHLPTFKPSSQGPFRVYLESQLLPAFGPLPVSEITPEILSRGFYAYSQTRPGGATQALGHFVSILNWGKAQGYLPHDLPNPASPLRRTRRTARGRMLSFEQIKALAKVLDSARGQQGRIAQAIKLILLTGCRRGEILSLRWEDVHPTRLTLPDSKTGPRDVFLSEPARQTLAQLRKASRPGVFVFPSTKARSGHIEVIDATWASLRAMADLPPDIRIHDLRHTFASHAVLSGTSLALAGRLLGHRSQRSTERYTHLDGGELRKAAETVASGIDELMG